MSQELTQRKPFQTRRINLSDSLRWSPVPTWLLPCYRSIQSPPALPFITSAGFNLLGQISLSLLQKPAGRAAGAAGAAAETAAGLLVPALRRLF